MSRQFSSKKRNSRVKTPKPLIVIIAEGKNVTETNYFKSFQNQYASYNIKLLSVGHETDPKNMLERLEDYWQKQELNTENGDMAFVVLDLDCDEKKANLIKRLASKSFNSRFIVSNPCFEVWFLLHYKYSTHSYLTGSELINDLKTFIPDYDKTMDVSELLYDNIDAAISNAYKLKDHYETLGSKWPSNDCNPRTDVPVIIEYIK
ncbi:MAG: RloB domain-containing protein [Clostridia bacterium]|nr:RloB domain-containing protein [Clostridia bacterium]